MNILWVILHFLISSLCAQSESTIDINFTTSTTQSSNSCTTASWLAWSDWSSCSDECGSCGVQLRTRTCLTTDTECTCDGSSTGVQYCNLDICRYPRTTCCNNFKVTSYDGRFACLNETTSSS